MAVLQLSLSFLGAGLASQVRTAWMCVLHGGERRIEVERAQQLVPEWAAIHESN